MKRKLITKLLILALVSSTSVCTFAGCGKNEASFSSSAAAEAQTEPETQSKGGSYDFFYKDDLSEKDYNAMCDMIEERLKALDQDRYVKLKKDYKEKMIHVTFTEKADTTLFPSAFCKNDFKITDTDGNVLITPEDVESVEIYDYQDTGYLHFKFKEAGAARLSEATSKENPVLVYCLNGEQVNETQVIDVISNELYTAGFGNLLDLFLICIQKGPLPVDLFSTSQLYEGQESLEDIQNSNADGAMDTPSEDTTANNAQIEENTEGQAQESPVTEAGASDQTEEPVQTEPAQTEQLVQE